MSDQFLGEIRMVPFNFAPQGWAMCNGQLLSISQNTALFSLLGTFYGGDGVTTFALPNFQSRVPIHQGQGHGLSPYVIGQLGGVESVTLSVEQTAAHTHLIRADGDTGSNNTPSPSGAALATFAAGSNIYNTATDVAKVVTMSPLMVASTGGSQPHTNIQPYLVVTFIIALEGIYPSRN